MPMKAVLDLDNACVDNEYTVQFGSSGPLTVVELGDIRRVIEMNDNPDRTRTSGGRTMPGTFTISVPLGHSDDDAMQTWMLACLNKAVGHSRVGVVLYPKGSAQSSQNVNVTLSGCKVQEDMTPGASMDSSGKMQVRQYTISYDDVVFT